LWVQVPPNIDTGGTKEHKGEGEDTEETHSKRNGERVCHRVHNPGFKVRVLVSLGQEKNRSIYDENNLRDSTLSKTSEKRSGASEKSEVSHGEANKRRSGREIDPCPKNAWKIEKEATGVDLEPVSTWKQDGTRAIWETDLAKKKRERGPSREKGGETE
jgi:hypothetical protein